MADGPITLSKEECEEVRDMGRVAGGSLSEAMEASRLSTRLCTSKTDTINKIIMSDTTFYQVNLCTHPWVSTNRAQNNAQHVRSVSTFVHQNLYEQLDNSVF